MDNIFMIALQSSLFLGLIHGVNPCGHSWIVLAPFVAGERNGKRVSLLTLAFFGGTALACLGIGATLGAISMSIPPEFKYITDAVTAFMLVVLGAILIIKPTLLHHHDHEHDHHHEHEDGHPLHPAHNHTHTCCDHNHAPAAHAHSGNSATCCSHKEHPHHNHTHGCGCGSTKGWLARWHKAGAIGLFTIGFMNMIVPCPTVAIMYKYALDSGSIARSTSVFAIYALGTGISLAVVIYAIYKVTTMMRTLNKPWVEPLIMRTAGVLTAFFGAYSYFHETL
ncbi:sulfite exporter TauE/SafE family protein [Oleidesulfovibrio sp.]|uniref:urease accessory protein UreH domain-containing protein n=1 Tax=Oleidesulfovibrio sp. TaxID=2909707 RepID=UPI003A85357E